MRVFVKHTVITLMAGLGIMALATPSLQADDTVVKASPEEIAAEKVKRTTIEKALVSDPKNVTLRVELGRVLSDLGAFGNEQASDAAVKLLEGLHKEVPKDAEILAFYGNACTIYAQYASILTKLNWVHDGFDYMDAAVKAASENIDIRVTRAINSSQVPGFLGRTQLAHEDFTWLIKHMESNPKDFSSNLKRTIYYFDGKFALDQGEAEAVKLLAQAEAIPPEADDNLTTKIADLLKTARIKFAPATPIAKAP